MIAGCSRAGFIVVRMTNRTEVIAPLQLLCSVMVHCLLSWLSWLKREAFYSKVGS